MTFEKKGAYNSFVEDFHFVKTHLHYTFMTWLIVIAVGTALNLLERSFESADISAVSFTAIGVIIIILLEVAVSSWEHVYIFMSYYTHRKKKIKVLK